MVRQVGPHERIITGLAVVMGLVVTVSYYGLIMGIILL